MRVLYFTRDYTPHDHRFLTALAGTPHQIYYLRLAKRRRPLQLEDRPLPPEVEQVHWRGGQKPFQWQALPGLWVDLRKVLARLKPDVVHAGPIQSAAFLAALSGFQPLVSMSWGSDLLVEADRTLWLNWVTRYTLRHTRVLVGDCQAVRRKAEALGFAGERVALFPWGVDLQHFSPARGGIYAAGWAGKRHLFCCPCAPGNLFMGWTCWCALLQRGPANPRAAFIPVRRRIAGRQAAPDPGAAW